MRRVEEVEKAKKKLSDLNATQIQVTKKLIEKRNLLLSMPQDSPPTAWTTAGLPGSDPPSLVGFPPPRQCSHSA